MFEAFQLIRNDAGLLGHSLVVMIELNLASITLALIVGTVVGLARHYGGPVAYHTLGLFVDALRSIPLLVIIVWTFFALPYLLGMPTLPAFTSGVIALSVHTSAYVSEIVRGGLASVRSGQMAACIALGMTKSQAVRRVILPQALIRGLPSIGTRVVKNIKDSVLASTIAVKELFWAATLLENELARPFLVYTTLMLFYFLVNMTVTRSIEHLYQRVAVLGRS